MSTRNVLIGLSQKTPLWKKAWCWSRKFCVKKSVYPKTDLSVLPPPPQKKKTDCAQEKKNVMQNAVMQSERPLNTARLPLVVVFVMTVTLRRYMWQTNRPCHVVSHTALNHRVRFSRVKKHWSRTRKYSSNVGGFFATFPLSIISLYTRTVWETIWDAQAWSSGGKLLSKIPDCPLIQNIDPPPPFPNEMEIVADFRYLKPLG